MRRETDRSLAAVRYLEHIQRTVNDRLGRSTAELNAQERAEFIATAAERFAIAKPKHPGPPEAWAKAQWDEIARVARARGATRFEVLTVYVALLDRIDEIEAAAATLNVQVSPRPVIGTLVVPRVNARSIVVPGTREYIVVVDSEFFVLCMLLSKAIVNVTRLRVRGKSLETTDERGVRERVAKLAPIRDAFAEALERYVMEGAPSKAAQYWLKTDYQRSARVLWESMERFALAHEYSHFSAGHLTANRLSAGLLAGERVTAYRPDWQQEYEADWRALPLMLRAGEMRGVNIGLSFLATDLMLAGLDIAERAISIVRAGDEDHVLPSKTHPPPFNRRMLLRGALRQLVPNTAEEFIELADMLSYATTALWTAIRHVFIEHYRKGTRRIRYAET